MTFSNMFWVAIICFATVADGSAQTKLDLSRQARNADFADFPTTRPFSMGPTLPVSCQTGEAFYKEGVTAGENVYLCTSPDVWTQTIGPAPLGAPYLVLDNYAGLSSERKVVAEQGVMVTDGGENGTATFGVDPTYVSTLGGNNAFLGDNDFSNATELRLLTGTGTPLATKCDAADEVGRVYVRSDSEAADSTLYVCAKVGSDTHSWEGPYKSAVAAPGGTDSELQYRAGGSTFGGVTGSVVSGNKLTLGPDATKPALNVGSFPGDPSSPDNGDVWYNSVTNRFRCRENGVTTDCTAVAPPLTTKGDLHAFGTSDARVPVGSDGQVLAADSTAAEGIAYGYFKEEISFRLGTRSDSSTDYSFDVVSDSLSGMTIGSIGTWPASTLNQAVLADDADGGGVLHVVLPTTYVGNATVKLYWRTDDAGTDSVRWQIDYDCAGDGEDSTPASLSSAGGVSSPSNGSDLLNVTSVPLALTGCAGGDWLRLHIFRDGNGTTGTDDLTADIGWLGGQLTFLRRLQ